MASPFSSMRQRVLVAIVCLSLIFTGVLALTFSDDAVAPSPPYIDDNGNMIVSGGKTAVIENFGTQNPYKHNGDIIINQASTLIIRNSTFMLKPDTNHPDAVTITQNGKLIIDNSIFTVDLSTIQGTYLVRFDVYQGTMEIRDSSIILPGTFNFTSSTFKAINSEFKELSVGYGSPVQIFNDSYVYYEDCNVKDFKVINPIRLLEDTSFIAINTFFDLDYDTKQMTVANSSRASLYGVSINPGLFKYKPINVLDDACWVKIYRWLEISTIDMLNIPIGNARLSVKNQTDIFVQPPPKFILDYLGKTSGNFNYTNSSGLVLLPLMSDNLTKASMPNSISTANYKLTAYKGQSWGKSNVGLPGYPLLSTLSNTPNSTIVFKNIITPRGNKYYTSTSSDIIITDATGKIKNSIFQKPQGGVVDLSFGQQGNIIINGSGIGGQLDLTGTKLGIEQDATHKYYILTEQNGRINFASKSGIMDGAVSPGIYPINIYMQDSSEMTLKGESILKNIGSFGMDSDSQLTLDNSELHGMKFYANGEDGDLNINAMNDARINVSAITLKSVDVSLENTMVTTGVSPLFEDITMVAKNTSFDQKLAFRKGSMAWFYNVTEPYFFNVSAKDTSVVQVYWYLTVVIKDQQGNRLKDAVVRIFNYTLVNGNLVPVLYKKGVTDKNGEFTYPVLGGKITSAGHYFGGLIGNYYINASYFGTESDVVTGRGGSGSRQGGSGVDVFGENQEVEITIPGTPDLTVSQIVQVPSPTEKNKETTIKVGIQNIGNFTAFNVEVEIWDTNLNKLLSMQTIPYIGPGNTSTINAKHKYTLEGVYEIRVLIDSKNKIEELNENNNVANNFITIISTDKADLTIVKGSLITIPNSPISLNSKVMVNARLRNVGTFEAKSFYVRFLIINKDSPGQGPVPLGDPVLILSLKPNQTSDIIDPDYIWEVNTTGKFSIEVVADYNDLIDEYNETNNSAIIDIDTVIGPDLTITKISFLPKPPITRESSFNIVVQVENIGPSNTSNFYLGFYLNTLGNQLTDKVLVTKMLNPNDSTEVELIISKDFATQIFSIPDQYVIYTQVDPDNSISETNESNNQFWVDLIIKKKADLSIKSEDIAFSVVQADNGVDIDISAKVLNIGETTSQGYTIRFFDGAVQIGPDILQAQGLKPNEAKTHTIRWNSTKGGIHNIKVVILTETDQEKTANDQATNKIYVKTKPDLYITAADIKTDKDEEAPLEGDNIKMYITIHNLGNTTAEKFNIAVWDGNPELTGSKRIVLRHIFSLSANSNMEITADKEFEAGLHYIYVICDIDNVVEEFDELNNIAFRSIYITPTAPDLTIIEDDREIRPIVSRIGPGGISQPVETTTINNGENYKFEIWISNIGNERAQEFNVSLFMDNDKTLLATKTIDNLSGVLDIGEENRVMFTVDIPNPAKYDSKFPGFHNLIVDIDTNKRVFESEEENNYFIIENAFKIVNAKIQITRIEILDSAGNYIYVNSETQRNPKDGELITIVASVNNVGTEPGNVSVEFYIDEQMVTQTPKKPMSSKVEGVAFNWQTTSDGELGFTVACVAKGNFGPEEDLPVASEKFEEYIPPAVTKNGGDEVETPWMLIMIIIVIIVIVCLVVGLIFLKKKREKMAECSECGALIPIDATECPKCGAEFSDEIECGECGALMKITDTICPACGAVFTKEGETEGAETGEPGEEIPGGPGPGVPGAPDAGAPGAGPRVSVQDLKAKTRATPTPPKPPAGKPKAASAPPGPKPGPQPKPAAPTPAPMQMPIDEDLEKEEETEERAECYRCGAIVPLSASMCPECGAEFE